MDVHWTGPLDNGEVKLRSAGKRYDGLVETIEHFLERVPGEVALFGPPTAADYSTALRTVEYGATYDLFDEAALVMERGAPAIGQPPPTSLKGAYN